MTKDRAKLPANYPEVLDEIKGRIRQAQVKAALSVNRELISLYWEIGQRILQSQAQEGWGAKVIDRLAAYLRKAFPDTQGFSARKLKYKGKWEQSIVKHSQAGAPFVDPDSHATKTLEASLAWNEDAFKQFAKLLVGRIENLSDLVTVYRKHAPEVQALLANIERTDDLIDPIVYKLYGLSDEEIAAIVAYIRSLSSTEGE